VAVAADMQERPRPEKSSQKCRTPAPSPVLTRVQMSNWRRVGDQDGRV
jgi:hypothetical protein